MRKIFMLTLGLWAAPGLAQTMPIAAPQPASAATRAANAAAATGAAGDAAAEAVEDAAAARGLIAQLPGGNLVDATGRLLVDRSRFAFLESATAPDSVNPRLWRQARRNAQHGLFEVVPGVWQFRGYDVSVMSFIKTDNGIIIVDPLTTEEAARAGLALFRQHVGNWPVRAVILSHSHIDHFGGVRGVVDAADVASGAVQIIAPHGFTEEAVSENLLAGPAMLQRANYMFGISLPSGPTGYVDNGLGPRLAGGTSGFLAPSHVIGAAGETMRIDGLELVFADAAATEAPAELVFYVPRYALIHSTEVVTKTLHNLLTLRGAQVRDALRWSQVIDAMLQQWGGTAQVRVGSHGWPSFGNDRVRAELAAQRDMYRFVHDRSLQAANAGATIQELPDALSAAPGLAIDPSVRGYYGTINHDAKAVYQRYFGWWDGVPAHFNPLPPVEAARHYVALAGGSAAMLAAGRAAHSAGDDRWAAELLQHLVFAEPENADARRALSDAYEQLGYRAESGVWRNYYLAAAATLRGASAASEGGRTQNDSFVAAVPTLDLFNAMATRYAPQAAVTPARIFRFRFTDTHEQVAVETSGVVEIPRLEDASAAASPAVAEVTLSRRAFAALLSGRVAPAQLVAAGQLQISGDLMALGAWLSAHRAPPASFAIVTP